MSVNLLPLVMAVYTGEFGLTLPMLPWHSMVAATVTRTAQRHQLPCVFDPSSPEDLSLPSQRPWQSMCAHFQRDVRKSWTSGHSPSDFRFHDICSERSPDSSWDTRRALHRSPPNEFDCHAPSSRGSFRHASRCTQRWLVHATPVVITLALTTLGAFDDSVMNSPLVV